MNFFEGTDNLEPILFHAIHGEKIRVSSDGSIATRDSQYGCGGIAFSSRSIEVNEKVYFKIARTSNWYYGLCFGFTTKNPSSYSSGHQLPDYIHGDWIEIPGNLAKGLPNEYATENTIICYYVKPDGNVHYTVNGEDKGIFFSGVETSSPLFAVIDIYGHVTTVEFLNPMLDSANKSNLKNEQVH